MQTTLKKVTFVAISPNTGEVFTRKSDHDYTYAVIYYQSAESVAEGLLREASYHSKAASQYNIIADLLELGAEPSSTEPLHGFLFEGERGSLNSQRAGVKTRWQDVLYSIATEPTPNGIENRSHSLFATRADAVTGYRKWAEENAQSVAFYRERAAKAEENEAVTFHSSISLASKKAQAEANKPYWTTATVVKLTTK